MGRPSSWAQERGGLDKLDVLDDEVADYYVPPFVGC
jgi:hypothetical protein